LLADMEYNLTFEGEEFLSNLSPRKRIDLYLFYKECLTNVLRHASATHVTTRLIAGPKALTLTITDNGIGIKFLGENPASLKRRARLLGAHLSTEHPASGGTHIILTLKKHKWNILK
jgi:signal transduction histidine kinase